MSGDSARTVRSGPLPWWLAMMALLAGCAHSTIKGTSVPDTPANRQIYEQILEVEKALRKQEPEKLLSLVSRDYFEDMGTMQQDDDFGYHELRTRYLPQVMEAAKEVYININVHEIVVNKTTAHADIRYESRARLSMPSGSTWDSHQDFNRLEFKRKSPKHEWKIVSGL